MSSTKNASSPTGPIYALYPARIAVGDIVLTSRAELASWGIRRVTRSDYSHAALCTRPGMLLEATPTGVLRRAVIGTYVHRPEWLMVLRPTYQPATEDERDSFTARAEELYGRPYWTFGALASPLESIDLPASTHVFCSHLVAETFASLGIELVPGVSPQHVKPSDLAESPVLKDITGATVRTVTPDEPIYRWIVEIDINAPHTEEMQRNRRSFEALRRTVGPAFPTAVGAVPELFGWLADNAGSDNGHQLADTTAAVFEREGFFRWYDEWAAGMRARVAVIRQAAEAVEGAERDGAQGGPEVALAITDFQSWLPSNEAILEGRFRTLQNTERQLATTGLHVFRILRDQYLRAYEVQLEINVALTRLISALQRINGR